MSVVKHTEYEEADETVKGVYEDIMEVRKSDTVNNFWKVFSVDQELLKTTWQETNTVMASGKIYSLVK